LTTGAEAPRPRTSRAAGLVSALTVLIALGSSLVALGFSLWPTLKPDPGTELGAAVEVLAVERYVTEDEWLRRMSASADDFAVRRAERVRDGRRTDVPGELAYVRVSVRGFKGDKLRLRWAVYDYPAQEPRDVTSWTDVEDTEIEFDAPRDDMVVEQWLGPVPAPRRYFVRFAVRTGAGALLDIADSKPFVGLEAR
jgi:hypothetical protein